MERSTQCTSFSSRKEPANAGSERKQFTENASKALQQIILMHAQTKCPPVRMFGLVCFFEFLASVFLILCFISMIFQVRKHNRSACIVAKQIRFNHQVSSKTHHEKSVVIMMGLVIGVFLVLLWDVSAL